MSTAIQEVEKTDICLDTVAFIVVFNTDYNTFEEVEYCLIQYCDKSFEEAQELSWKVHTEGRANVKEGEYIDLLPICQALVDYGLQAEIQK